VMLGIAHIHTYIHTYIHTHTHTQALFDQVNARVDFSKRIGTHSHASEPTQDTYMHIHTHTHTQALFDQVNARVDFSKRIGTQSHASEPAQDHEKEEDAVSESRRQILQQQQQQSNNHTQGLDGTTSELKEWSMGHDYASGPEDAHDDDVYYVDVADAGTQYSVHDGGVSEEGCADASCQTERVSRESCATQTVDFEGSVMRMQRAYSRSVFYLCVCVCVCVGGWVGA
jgi:hypothetical protein